MERRQLGLEQRAHSLDMLSPEKRVVFASLDAGPFKTSSQESINAKLNNLRLKGAGEPSPEENVFSLRFGSLSKLARRGKNRELRRNIPEDVRRACEAMENGGTLLGENDTEEEEGEAEENGEGKVGNTSLTNLSQYATERTKLNGFLPVQSKDQRERDNTSEGQDPQPHAHLNV